MAHPPSHAQAVLPNPTTLILDRIERDVKYFRVFVWTHQAAPCPVCSQVSVSRHSAYSRRLSDLPWQGFAVQIWLTVHRYRCRNPLCSRKIFCERMPGVARAYARQTDRLTEIIMVVGYIAGGLPGARLLDRLSVKASDDTVRRRVSRNLPLPPEQRPDSLSWCRRLGLAQIPILWHDPGRSGATACSRSIAGSLCRKSHSLVNTTSYRGSNFA